VVCWIRYGELPTEEQEIALHLVVAPAVFLLYLSAACVDLTPPWNKPDAGLANAGGGRVMTTTKSADTESDADVDGAAGNSLSSSGGSIATGGVAGGAKDAGSDHPLSSTGKTGGAPDGGVDVSLPGTGGVGGGGGVSSKGGDRGGATASAETTAKGGTSATAGTTTVGGFSAPGGTVATGGVTLTGGTTRTGGTTVAGGSTASGGTINPDAGPDAPPDVQPDGDPLLAGLLVYYRFESANGTVTPDSSGHGYDGILSVGVPPDGGAAPTGAGYEFVTGKVGKGLALHKDGKDYVRIPPEMFRNVTEITIAAWVNITTEQTWARVLDVGVTPPSYLFRNTPTGTKYMNLVPHSGANNRVFAITTNGYDNEQRLTAAPVPTNTWTHLAVVLGAGGEGRLYINGTEVLASSTLTLRPQNLGTIDYAFIGKSCFDADPYLDAIVDGFRVYNRALSAAEIQALYQYTIGP